MPPHLSSLFLVRLVLPLSLGACAVIRQNLFSLIYLLLFFMLPFIKVPTLKNMAGTSGRYLLAVMIISVLTTVAQLSFHIVLLSMPPYGYFLNNCGLLEKILRHVGLVKLSSVKVLTLIRLTAPEVVMLLTSVTVYTICSKIVRERRPSQVSDVSTPSTIAILPHMSASYNRNRHLNFITSVGKYLSLASLCVASAMRPSIPGSVYFVVFLGAMTWWACYKSLGRAFAMVLRAVVALVALHVLALFAIQLQCVQDYLPAEDCSFCRYFGLTVLVMRNCTNPQEETFARVDWDYYLNPVILLFLFYILVIESHLLLKPRAGNVDRYAKKDNSKGPLSRQISVRLSQRKAAQSSASRWRSATRRVRVRYREDVSSYTLSERTSLIRAMSPTSKYSAGNCTAPPGNLHQDAHGSVTITDGFDDGQLRALEETEQSVGLCEKTLDCILAIFQMISRSSYVGTSITMMAWSITYHSWLTFVLLLWASVLWIIPNQRRSMLRCSPFLVFYALFLLMSQYVYGMELTEAELPQEVEGLNLKQIGFVKAVRLPVKPVLAKVLYTIMFWLTLRQFMQETFEQHNTSTLQDMVAPLQITVGAATRGFSDQREPESSPIMKKVGELVQHFLTKFWIWIVAIMLFVISFVGEKMTVLRIIYMALFLFFILTFQISYHVWRKTMYAFWLVVILYSMSILVLIYTYQFDNFPEYWVKYLGVSLGIQDDLGLKRYDTGVLFARLLVPAFFLVITVIQLHYYHNDFLAISEMKSSLSAGRPSQGSIVVAGDSGTNQEFARPRGLPSLRTLKHLSKEELLQIAQELRKRFNDCLELGWCFLELHLLKIMMLSVVLMCIYDVCALHFLLLLLVVATVSFGRRILLVTTHVIAVLVSFLLLAKMIYQIDFFKHHDYSVNCSLPGASGNFNDAEWFGFQKKNSEHSLADLTKGYIGMIVLATVLSVVDIRQMYVRHVRGQGLARPLVLFPNTRRENADDSIRSCLKYLLNYGFYKFGIEICLVMLVILIASRMDVYAVLYAFWLGALFSLKREILAKVWPIFQVFIIIFIPIQYAMAVGLPPGLCKDYPWYKSDTLRRLQDWLYLPDPLHPPSARKLICDFLLLLFVCRQRIVFYIEKIHINQEYPGGSNRDIEKEVEEPSFKNSVPDFVTYTRSWLDVLKFVTFQIFLWVTLGLVFLAGTNRVNVFSIGYLVGTFIFLWRGEETYLMPLGRIVKCWNVLLGYNVSVIVIKAWLQIVGCVFIKHALRSACWAVQLLGIGCVRKIDFLPGSPAAKDMAVCSVPVDHVGLAWDAVCFTALVFMRRLFCSYYFVHMVNETKAMTVLASRGAELIEELRVKRIVEQQDQEHQILEKIKMKMERIKATQQKIHGSRFKEPAHHFEAIRSGDYYMFEELDDIELEEDKTSEQEDDDKAVTLGKFLSTAMKTDLEQAADLAFSQPQSTPPELEADDRPPPLPRQQSSSFFTAQSQVASPLAPAGSDPSLHGDNCDGSAESKGSYHSVDGQPPGGSGKGDQTPLGSEHTLVSETDKESEKEPTILSKIWTYIKVLWAFIESAMVSLTKYLNRNSKDYRYVVKILSMEKKMLKATSDFGLGIRSGPSMVWQPLPSVIETRKSRQNISEQHAAGVGESSSTLEACDSRQVKARPDIPEIRILAPSLERGLGLESMMRVSLEQMEEDRELSAAGQPPVVQLCVAVYYSLMSHSELVCYFMVFLHQIKSATILSLPLPLMVFLWGTLTVPRPTKTFWITLIAYTEVVVIIKCLFQFELIPWNQQPILDNMPFAPARIIGIERKPNYATYDLALLLIIFFHRVMLKSMGLWKSTYEDPVPFSQKEEVFVVEGSENNSGSDRMSRKISMSSVSSLGRQVVTPAGCRLSAIRSSEDVGDDGGDAKGKQLVVVVTEPQKLLDHYPGIIKLATMRYFASVKLFFKYLLAPTARVTADVYTWMFLCDFFNFLVIIFGFAAFGTQQGDGGVAAYLEENKVPVPFLLMLILQFGLIIIDRALYLRKFILGKVIFQFLLVVGIHVWMFFILPGVTERQFNAALPPQMWYMVKCFYLLLSAYQIRCGYPTRILGNVLCKRYNILNLVMFKVYLLVPFLFELRALMDWVWTETSMTLFDWLKMEDIFNNIFQHKCSRRMENEYPQPRGERKNPTVKYLMGGGFLVVIIGIIWFPLVLFALGSTVGQPNLPYDVTMSLHIGPYQPVYRMSAQNNSIYRLNEQQWEQMLNAYQKDRVAQTFLSGYDSEDIGVISMWGNSTAVWGASPPDLERLIAEVKSANPLVFKLMWTVSRHSNSREYSGTAEETREWVMNALDEHGDPNPQRDILANMLSPSGNSSKSIILSRLLPKFLKVTNRNTAQPVKQLMMTEEDDLAYRNLSIHLYRDLDVGKLWWELKEENCPDPTPAVLKQLPYFKNDCVQMLIYTFNEKAFPKGLSVISGGGIIGLYTTMVLIASNVIRGFFSGICNTIMFDDMPNVDRILQLCLDIYLVRESREFALEEDLFAKLVFLYRSPETLIKWTRPPEEGDAEDEDQPPAVQQ
ncbi:piezo-type mechanosensitive ion channel component-like isoform X9 [Bacillus rossius redtenbacheri]|uniref:piezo-type mechanosensitive ion channel component-like isoform X9 n=1 Tax=Bacillus rossius redtenbacheri TaxID=93214 RepID=UPI002FDD160D